jgi:hypothetical protein
MYYHPWYRQSEGDTSSEVVMNQSVKNNSLGSDDRLHNGGVPQASARSGEEGELSGGKTRCGKFGGSRLAE